MLLLASFFTDLVLGPIQETGMTPVKLYTTKVPPFNVKIGDNNWSIIAVREIFVVHIFLFRTVTFVAGSSLRTGRTKGPLSFMTRYRSSLFGSTSRVSRWLPIERGILPELS